MGNVGDQLGFEPLAFELLRHRLMDALPDPVYCFPMPVEGRQELFRMDFGFQLALGQLLGHLLDGAKLNGPIAA